ncbi:reverse transcriptase-like protein [Areca yellow leaf disease phytoplasma]|uniref:reverse transcriptase-like protein n=1 Tax=Areca yellow leaf disease phytoplasma TaxID=927614 RepID=UPI0035B54A5C
MKIAKEVNVRRLKVLSDSQLVVNQVKGDFEVHDTTLSLYLKKVKELGTSFDSWDISHIPRIKNSRADALSRLATSTPEQMGRIFVEYLEIPSISATEKEKVLQIEPEMNWMDPIVKYLTEGILPKNDIEAKQIRKWAAQYVILDGLLYKNHLLSHC